MAFLFSKIDGKLNFNDLGGYETRNPSTIWCIQKADEKYNLNDETPFDTLDELIFQYFKEAVMG